MAFIGGNTAFISIIIYGHSVSAFDKEINRPQISTLLPAPEITKVLKNIKFYYKNRLKHCNCQAEGNT